MNKNKHFIPTNKQTSHLLSMDNHIGTQYPECNLQIMNWMRGCLMRKILATVAISALLSTNDYAADNQESVEYDNFINKINAKSLTTDDMKKMKGSFDNTWLFGGSGFG